METFQKRRAVALEILAKGENLTRKSGSFLGQCAVDENPLTPRQEEWFCQLAAKAGVEIGGAT